MSATDKEIMIDLYEAFYGQLCLSFRRWETSVDYRTGKPPSIEFLRGFQAAINALNHVAGELGLQTGQSVVVGEAIRTVRQRLKD